MTAKTTKNTVSPGHKAWDQARGVEPRRDPKTIDHNFVADPRGGSELQTPHGVAIKGDRERAHQDKGK